MRYTKDAKEDNKVGTAFHLLCKYLGMSALHVDLFLLILFSQFFVVLVILWIT
jgi:hypothetical protein